MLHITTCILACFSVQAGPDQAVGAHLYRLWHPYSGAPISLVALSVPSDLVRVDGGWSAPVSVSVFRWTRRIATLPVLERTAAFPVNEAATLGLLELPGSDGIDTWQVAIRGVRGGTRRTDVVRLAPLEGTTPILSDLVLGQVGEAAGWWGTGDPMPVAARLRFRRDRPLEVLAQLKSVVPLTGLRIRITVGGAASAQDGQRREVAIEARLDLAPGITTIRRTLGLDQLAGGLLQITFTVVDARGTVVSRRVVEAVLREG